jgi:hypothetical protein
MRWWLLIGVLVVPAIAEARRFAPKPTEPPHHPSLTWVDDEPVSERVVTPLLEDPMFELFAELTDLDAAKIVRSHLIEIKACYRLERGSLGRMKAMLSLDIDSDGAVTRSSLEASALAGSNVASCVKNAAQRWSFPRSFTRKHFSYPIVFIDG